MTDWVSLGRKIAAAGLPAVGAALGGPMASAAGARLAQVLDVEASPDVIAKAVAADPDAMIALRRVEAEMASAEQAHDERMAAAQEAERDRLRQQGGILPWMAPLVFLVLSCMEVALWGALLVGDQLTDQAWQFVNSNSSMLHTAWVASVVYFVGSSAGSASKERALADRR